MRKVFIGLAIAVLVLIVAAVAIPRLVDVNHFRPQIEARLEEKLGRDVSLGRMGLSLFPPAFRVEDAVIAEDPEFNTGRPFAQVETLFVQPELLPLLRGDIQIRSLQLQRPALEFVRSANGTWNFTSLMREEKQTTTKPESKKPQSFSLAQMKIYDGFVGLTDAQKREARAVYDHIDLILRDFAPEKVFSFEVFAHMPGAGEQMITMKGEAGPIQRAGVARTAFEGQLQLKGVSLAGLDRFVNGGVLANSDAVLTGSAHVKSDAGILTSSGQFEARRARIRGVEIAYPITADYDITSNLNESTAQIQKADLKLGQTPVSVAGSINGGPTPIVVDLNVKTNNASIAEVARLASAFGVAFNPKNQVTGALNANVHARGAVNKPVLNGQVMARDLRMSGGDLPEPVQVDAVELSLSPDAIRSNEFTAKTGRTAATAQFTVSKYSSDTPELAGRLNTGNAEMGELLRIARAYGISAVDGIKGSGAITLNVEARGPITHTGNLTYNGSGTLRNASLHLPSLAKPLEVSNADLSFTANSVLLNNLDMSIGQTAARGNMAVRNFSSPQMDFALSANKINLAEWQEMGAVEKAAQPSQASAKSNVQGDNVLTRARGSGTLQVGSIVNDDLVLNDVRSTVTLDHGIITMKPVTAGLYGGQQVGSIVVNARARPVTYTVDSKLQDVDANRLLSSISPAKATLYGVLSALADTHFTVTAGAASIAPTLNGKFSLNLKDGKIANMDLLHQLATIAKFQRVEKAVEPFTNLVQLSGDFNIVNGVARTNNLKAVIEGGTFAANGAVDLAQQKLELRLTAVLSREYSEKVGGTNIGGFMTTALANRKGELVIPVIVSGTFHDPQFAPDIQKIAEMKLENLLPSTSNPGELNLGILGQVLRRKPGATEQSPSSNGTAQPESQQEQPQPQQQQPQTEQEKPKSTNPLQDAIDSLLKKKKQ